METIEWRGWDDDSDDDVKDDVSDNNNSFSNHVNKEEVEKCVCFFERLFGRKAKKNKEEILK